MVHGLRNPYNWSLKDFFGKWSLTLGKDNLTSDYALGMCEIVDTAMDKFDSLDKKKKKKNLFCG